ncbi:MAG: STAS domain-containing protein [Betaproteobacteria bacterium]|nr:MAG: STAS domain-containing protein [Betaproteobacteria bacterium]TMH93070.1 MAG: STAS domain-containing protein [Betaproteobacteria bacterium]
MFFSLFGRKKTESKKKPITRQPVKPSPEKSATPVAGPQAGEDSLDFSAYVPPPQSTPLPASPAPAPAPQSDSRDADAVPAPPTLDVSALASSLAGEPGPAPSASPAPEVAPIIAEAATLFANGEVEQALARLSNSVREEDLGDSAQQAWLMLFDLYQHRGQRVEFEALALEFVVKFERSPPAWIESDERHDPALATGGIGYFALNGMLTGASAPELEKLRNTPGRTVRIECDRLLGLDGPGCRLLREALLSIRDAGKEVMFTGESRLLAFLERFCQPGKIEADAAAWALLLDVYRTLDLKDKFEEAAVNYAVTFEVSPPSWEPQPKAEARRSAVLRPVEAAEQALILSGELSGAGEPLARQLQDWAGANKMLVVDMSRATRVDLATAGLMLRVLSELQKSGTTIQIRGANELICALFGVVGLNRVARIIPRK